MTTICLELQNQPFGLQKPGYVFNLYKVRNALQSLNGQKKVNKSVSSREKTRLKHQIFRTFKLELR